MIFVFFVIDVNIGITIGTYVITNHLGMDAARFTVPAQVNTSRWSQNSSRERTGTIAPELNDLGVIGVKVRAGWILICDNHVVVCKVAAGGWGS